jgi:hypothetical protein
MIQTIRLEKTDLRNEDCLDTPLFSQQLQQEIIDTFNEKILSDERPAEKHELEKQQIVGQSIADYEDLCNLNESVLKRLQTAQIGKEMSKHSSTTMRPLLKNLEQQFEKNTQVTRNHRHGDIYSRFNIWPANLNISKSSRMVDWSDKLKHMEIKDVMDIDIGNMTEEFNSIKSNGNDHSEGPNKKNSILDDSFTQYLEKLKQEDDLYMEKDELNYKLDQLGSY